LSNFDDHFGLATNYDPNTNTFGDQPHLVLAEDVRPTMGQEFLPVGHGSLFEGIAVQGLPMAIPISGAISAENIKSYHLYVDGQEYEVQKFDVVTHLPQQVGSMSMRLEAETESGERILIEENSTEVISMGCSLQIM
jgi:hypothetical protein